VEVDRYMVCDTGGERIAEYLALLDEWGMMFSDEVVVKDRVGVRFSGKGAGSEGGRRDRKTAISDNKFEIIDHIQELTPSVVGGWNSSRCEGVSRGMSQDVSPERRRRVRSSWGVK